MKQLILIISFTIGCSSHVSSPGYAELEDGAAGAGGLLEVDADVADRIIDAYQPSDAVASDAEPDSGDAALPPGGQCPVLLAFPCEPSSCSGSCACNDYARWKCVAASGGAYCECS
jgi:hypothetical protein